MTTEARNILLVGPKAGADATAEPLWQASVSVSHKGSGLRPVPERSFGVRVLLQDSVAVDLPAQPRRLAIGTPAMRFHTPRLVELLLSGEIGLGGHYLTLLGQRAAIVAHESDSDQALFSKVRAAPLVDGKDWPHAHAKPLEPVLPAFRLVDGRLRVRVQAKAAWLTQTDAGRGKLFGSLDVALDGDQRFVIDLVGQGMEFGAAPPNPLLGFGDYGNGDQRLDGARLCLRKLGEDNLVLDLIGFQTPAQAQRCRAAFEALVDSLERRRGNPSAPLSPLRLRPDSRLAVPSLRWPLLRAGNKLTLADPRSADIDPAALAPGLDFGADAQGNPSAATFVAASVTLTRDGDNSRLTLSSGKAASAPTLQAIVLWDNDELSATLRPRKGTLLRAALDVVGLRERLGALYRRARALPADRADAPYVYLPLRHGLLQVPLPDAESDPAEVPPPAGLVDILSGTLELHAVGAHGVLSIETLDSVRIDCVWRGDSRVLDTVRIEGGNPGGTLSRVLWSLESSPGADEMLPSLRNGPIATRDLRLRFGGPEDARLSITTEQWSSKAGLRLTFGYASASGRPTLAWLGHPTLPLLALHDMLACDGPARKPSLWRGVFPHRLDGATGRTALTLNAGGGPTPFPTVEGDWPLWAGEGDGWPFTSEHAQALNSDACAEWPAAPSVDAFVATAPDVMITPSRSLKQPTLKALHAVLRFDLAALDGYFAALTLPQPARASVDAPAAPPLTTLQADALPVFWRQVAARAALARTESAFVTRWTDASKPAGAVSNVTGLFVPYSWAARFSFAATDPVLNLPFGAYSLTGAAEPLQLQSGAQAVAGLTTELAFGEQPLNVKGFAVAATEDINTGNTQDSRGGSVASEAWTTWSRIAGAGASEALPVLGLRRAATQLGGKVQLATLAEVLHFAGPGGVAYCFACTDLPLRAAGEGTLQFVGVAGPGDDGKDVDPMESAPSTVGAAFSPSQQGSAAMRWRFFQATPSATMEFDVPLGPLRFKPLRLARLVLGGDDTERTIVKLEILGRVRVAAPAAAGVVGVDGGDEDGNLAVLELAVHDGKLCARHLRRVRLAGGDRLRIEPSAAPLCFMLEEDPFEDLAAPQWSVGAAQLQLTLNPAADLHQATLTPLIASAAILLQGLGADQLLAGATVTQLASPQPAFELSWDAPAPDGEGLFLSRLALRWPLPQGQSHVDWCMALRTAAPTDAQAAPPKDAQALPPPLAVRLTFRRRATARMLRVDGDWLGAGFGDIRRWRVGGGAPALLDPERGSLQLVLNQAGLRGVPVQGLAFDWTPKRASLMLVALLGTAGAGPHLRWPLASVRCDIWTEQEQLAAPRGAFHHRIEKQGGEWLSRLEVSGLLRRASCIHWPAAEVAQDRPFPLAAPDPADQARFVAGVTGGAGRVTINAGTALLHTVALRLVRHVLPLSLLKTVEGRTYIAAPWSVLASVEHELCKEGGGPAQLAWRSLDDVAIVDCAALVETCKQERELLEALGGPYASGANQAAGKPVTYAFGARYMSDTVDQEGAARVGMVQAGIGVRSYVNAGFPAWRIAQALSTVDDAPHGLLLSGAGVTRFPLPSDTAGAQPWLETAHMLAMPWLLAPDVATGFVDEHLTFRQSGGGVAWDVADADLAAAVAVSAPRPPALGSLGVADTEAALHASLRAALATGNSDGDWRRAPLMSVEQAFMREVEAAALPDAGAPGATPFWIRSLLTVHALWRELITVREVAGRHIARTAGLVPGATRDGNVAMVEFAGASQSAPRARVAAVIAAEGVIGAAAGSGAVIQSNGAAWALGVARERSDRPAAVMLGNAADASAQPFCRNWAMVPLAHADDFGARPRALRRFDDLVFASGALDWPTAGAVRQLAGLAMAAGEEAIVQSDKVGLAGQLRTHGLVAQAPARCEALYLTFAERPVFHRAPLAPLPGPAALHLLPAPARQRAPVHARTTAQLASMTAGGAMPLPLVPPAIGHLTLGLRPGVIYQSREAALMPLSLGDGFDAHDPRFGTPAASGPTVLRQGRSPRSTLLPETASPARRRRTIVAWDDGEDGKPEEGKVPTPFRWLAGSAGVVRRGEVQEPVDKQLPRGETSYLVQVHYPQDGLLDGAWNRRIELRVSTAADNGAPAPHGFFTAPGTPPPLLIVGPVAVPLRAARPETAGHPARSTLLRYDLLASDAELIAVALARADGDTRATVVLRYLADGVAPAAAPGVNQLVPLTLTLELALTIAPANRAFVMTGLATLLFSDPSYDRILRSNTKSDGRPDADGATWLLAADREAYDRTSSVVFAFGQLDVRSGLFVAGGDYTLYCSWRPALADGGQGPRQDVYPDKLQADWRTPRHGLLGQPYGLPLASFVDADGQQCAMRPGDLLELAAGAGSAARAIQLRIVAGDVIAPAPSMFALVRVAADQASADVPLFASAPLPQTVSFVSIRDDLARGLVRRRAHFQWHHPHQDVYGGPGLPLATLVKIDRTGGAQLPALRRHLRALE